MIRKSPVSKEKALERLKSLCSRAEHCEFELNRKMINWGLGSSDRKEIIELLSNERYVDDARFAMSFAHDKAMFSAWGPAKIRLELIKRKINSKSISEALSKVGSEVWKEGLLKCARSKSANLELTGETGRENRNKLYRYLLSRGFPSGVASKAVMFMRKKQEEE